MNIQSTYFSPSVSLSDSELLCIGNFWMEDSFTFFESIKTEISTKSSKEFTIKFSIHHIHSSAIKQLYEFLKFTKNLKVSNVIEKLHVTFYYIQDDADLGDLINDMSELLDIEFNVFMLPEKTYFFS